MLPLCHLHYGQRSSQKLLLDVLTQTAAVSHCKSRTKREIGRAVEHVGRLKSLQPNRKQLGQAHFLRVIIQPFVSCLVPSKG